MPLIRLRSAICCTVNEAILANIRRFCSIRCSANIELARPQPRSGLSGCRCVGLFTLGELCRLNFGDHVNFDASAKWHLCHADGAARMDAALT
jgi:hypothetical protein